MKKLLFLLIIFTFVWSCEKSDNPVPDDNNGDESVPPTEIIISDDYLPLTEQNSSCTDYDTFSGVVEMYISDTTLVPKVGNVIVVDRDTLSAIRRIKSIENLSSGEFRFTTEPATMGDIFQKGSFALSTSSDPSTKAGIQVFKPTEIIYFNEDSTISTKGEIKTRLLTAEIDLSRDFKNFFSDDPDKDNCSISLGAESNILSSLDLTMQFNFDNSLDMGSKFSNNLVEFKAWLEGDVNVNIGIGISAQNEYEWTKEVKLKDNIIKPVQLKFIVSGVPIIVNCDSDLYGELSSSISGKCEVSIGAECNLNGKLGFEYKQSSKSLTNINEFSISAEPKMPSLSGEVSLKNSLSVFPRVSVFLYSLIGPVLDVKPFVSSEIKYGAEVNLVDKKDRTAPVLSHVAETGVNIAGKLHLNPFDKSGINDIVALDINLKQEIYRSPHKIEKKEVKTSEGGEKKVVFAVYDTLASKGEIVPTPLAIPVVVTKSSADNKHNGDDSTQVSDIELFIVKKTNNSEIEVPVDKNTTIVEEIRQTINADIYTESGSVISNASYSEVVKNDLREMLIEFYKSTDGDNWIRNDNWCSDKPIYTWYGVFYYQGKWEIDLKSNNLRGKGRLVGFTSLEHLKCSDNQLTTLDLTGCTSLEYLDCQNNRLTTLDLTGCTSLEYLDCHNNQLTTLDLTGYTSLEYLECHNNPLTTLDLTGCTSLKHLQCINHPLTALYATGCKSLESLDCNDNQLTTLDLTGCTSLEHLKCSDNQLTTLDLTGCTSLTSLHCYDNKLKTLDLTGCTSLEMLYCHDNPLTALDLTGCTSLGELYCSDNQLTTLDLTGCASLYWLSCDNNPLTTLYLTGCTSLKNLYCYNHTLTALYAIGCTSLERLYCRNTQLTTLDLTGCTSLRELDCSDNQFTTLDLTGCTSLGFLDCQNNRLTTLDLTGCTSLEYLYCHNNQFTTLDLTGYTSLYRLECQHNLLTTLYLTGCTSLEMLYCYDNPLTALYASGCTSLKSLKNCENTQMITLDVTGCTSLKDIGYWMQNPLTALYASGCTSLEYLEIWDNQLTTLDLTGCTSLENLACSNNQLTTLDLTGCTSLRGLDCSYNQLTTLDLTGCTSLRGLDCSYNQLTTLDLTGYTSLYKLECHNNPLTTLYLTGCTSLEMLYCYDNINLSSEIPAWFSNIRDFSYDIRYKYWKEDGKIYFIDKGYGWWYPGEPQKGYHGI